MNNQAQAIRTRPRTTLEFAESAECYMTNQITPELCRELVAAKSARSIRYIMQSWVGETLIDFEEAMSSRRF